MRTRTLLVILLLAGFSMAPRGCAGCGPMALGEVIDACTNDALQNATVNAIDEQGQVVTTTRSNPAGRYVLHGTDAAATLLIEASADGYRSAGAHIEYSPADTPRHLDWTLTPTGGCAPG